MVFFHYTAITYLEKILKEGLTTGELMYDLYRIENAIHFTTDPNPAEHGLSGGHFATPDEVARCMAGHPWPSIVPYFPDKRRVRITTDLKRSELVKWLPWANQHVERRCRANLISSGGNKAKAKTWYFSHDPISPSRFAKVEIRAHNGEWLPLENDTGFRLEIVSVNALTDAYEIWGATLLETIRSSPIFELEPEAGKLLLFYEGLQSDCA